MFEKRADRSSYVGIPSVKKFRICVRYVSSKTGASAKNSLAFDFDVLFTSKSKAREFFDILTFIQKYFTFRQRCLKSVLHLTKPLDFSTKY